MGHILAPEGPKYHKLKPERIRYLEASQSDMKNMITSESIDVRIASVKAYFHVFAAIASLEVVKNLIDLSYALMVIPNMIAILLLAPKVNILIDQKMTCPISEATLHPTREYFHGVMNSRVPFFTKLCFDKKRFY